MFRFFKAFLFLSVFAIVITLSVICELSSKDLIVCCLAFLPTGWGLILVCLVDYVTRIQEYVSNTGMPKFFFSKFVHIFKGPAYSFCLEFASFALLPLTF